MQPLDIKLAYKNQPWCTVRLEVSHNELGDADEVECRELPQSVVEIFETLGFSRPNAIPLMPLPFQIAQKLHGVTSAGSDRVRDLIDLQLIVAAFQIEMEKTADICRRLFAYRRRQPWPPQIIKGESWSSLYDEQRGKLSVLPTVDEAIAWANDLIAKIDQA